MEQNDHRRWSRRGFLRTVPVAVASAWASAVWGAERPAVTDARATSGDRLEPDWQRRLTVTVGPKKAHLVGTDHRVLQRPWTTWRGWAGGP